MRTASAASSGTDPAISAALRPPQLEVTGHGFRPWSGIVIRVIDPDDMANYFRYTAGITGDLTAALPGSIPHGTLRISATDSQPDPTDVTGIRWTNTTTVTW